MGRSPGFLEIIGAAGAGIKGSRGGTEVRERERSSGQLGKWARGRGGGWEWSAVSHQLSALRGGHCPPCETEGRRRVADVERRRICAEREEIDGLQYRGAEELARRTLSVRGSGFRRQPSGISSQL